MEKEYHLCMKCMNMLDETGTCKKCGYLQETPCLPFCLKPHTVLDDRYILGNVVSYNGESIVYIGFDTTLECKVYIKEFMPQNLCRRIKSEPGFTVKPEYLVNFKNCLAEFVDFNKSLMRMKSLSHIISVNDMVFENSTAYAVCDYYDGMTLRQYLAKKGEILGWDELKTLLPPILTTLGLLHNAGLYHLGISPDTIVLTKKGELKISGFSTMDERISDSVLAPELFPGYSAPEQYHNDMKVGEWSDVYAICAVLYRALTGIEPAESIIRTINDDLVEIEDMDLPVPKNIAEAIDDGICLDKDYRIMSVNDLVPRLFETTGTINLKKIREEADKTRVMDRAAINELTKDSKNTKPSSKNKKPDDKNKANQTFFQKYKLPIIVISATCVVMIIFITILAISLGGGSKKKHKVTEEPIMSSTVAETEQTTSAVTTAPAEMFTMIDLTGNNYDSLSKSLADMVTLVPDRQYNDLPIDTIVSQEIKAGEKVEKGSKVKVVVSKGPSKVIVPPFANMTIDDYKAVLEKAGIKRYTPQSDSSSSKTKGYVDHTSIAPGDYYSIENNDDLIIYYSTKEEKQPGNDNGDNGNNNGDNTDEGNGIVD